MHRVSERVVIEKVRKLIKEHGSEGAFIEAIIECFESFGERLNKIEEKLGIE